MATGRDDVPLMRRDNEESYDEAMDVRFTIDDEDNEGHGSELHDSTSRAAPAPRPSTSRQSRQSLDNAGRYESVAQEDDDETSHKYPPAAPPPSYREATGKSLLAHHLSSLCGSVSTPDFSPLGRLWARIWSLICRVWPTSRFAQVGLFMGGLWLLVIFSGPVFDELGDRAGAGYPWESMDNIGDQGPPPISGDGHIIANANWTLKSCRNRKSHGGLVVCISTTRIELKAPTNFASNEDNFIFADPPRRDHLTDGRGQVPGTIETSLVRVGTAPDQTPKDTVSVVIDAHYEQSRGEVFERTTVAKMGSRFVSEGVGIYSYPLPRKYRDRYPPPLYFDIKVLVPEGTTISALRAETSAMSIGGFTMPDPLHAPHKGRSVDAGQNRDVAVRAPSEQLAPPYFGRFVLTTLTGTIRSGSNVQLNAAGVVRMTSATGDVNVASNIEATEVRFESTTGHVRIEEGAQITAYREAHIGTRTGNIEMKPRASLMSSVIMASTQTGGILGGDKRDAGLWGVNHTMELKAANGPVRAAVAVHNISIPDWNPHNTVHVKGESQTGGVDLRFVQIDNGPSLQASADSSTGAVMVRAGPSYIGKWSLEGAKRGSGVVPPKKGDPRDFVTTDHHDSPISLRQSGTIGHTTHADDMDKKPAPDSQLQLKAKLGAAKLSFD